MSVKIQLDVPALERLIKDDKEMEVQLKQGVIMNFVDKHLRKLMKDEFLQNQINQIKNKVEKSVDEAVSSEMGKVSRDWLGRIDGIKVSPEFQKTLAIYAEGAVANEVVKIMQEKIEQYLTTKELDKYIERSVGYKLADLTKEEVRKRADEAMKKIEGKIK